MSTLSERKARLIVESLLIEDLRIQFKVRKTLKPEPTTAEISVSNLNEDSRAALQKKRVRCILEAGYLSSIAQIFSGDSRFVDQVQDGPTWVTKIECGDGERAYEYRRVAESFRPGTKVADVVNTVAKALGVPITGDLGQMVDEEFVQGYAAFGKAATELDHLLKSRGFEWSIQDGQLQILKADTPSPDSVIVVSPDTGMVGSPEHGNPEKQQPLAQLSGEAEDIGFNLGVKRKTGPAVLKVKSLLQPGFKPGRRVQIESRGVNGVFRIETVTHTGDTFGGDWYSELECLPSA